MNIYDLIKDALGIAKDNIEFQNRLLEIGQMAMDLQNENADLRKKIEELIRDQQFEKDIVRHIEPYYTLKSDGEESNIYYCSTCLGKENKKIQMVSLDESKLWCPVCKTSFHKTEGRIVQTVFY